MHQRGASDGGQGCIRVTAEQKGRRGALVNEPWRADTGAATCAWRSATPGAASRSVARRLFEPSSRPAWQGPDWASQLWARSFVTMTGDERAEQAGAWKPLSRPGYRPR
jgi:hypothetical protein